MRVTSSRRLLVVSLMVWAVAQPTRAANIDEVTYLTNKILKDLSSRAVSMIATSEVGVCGRRRELKITGRGRYEQWPEIIQSAIKRDQPSKRTVRVHSVGRSRSNVLGAVTRVLMAGGYHSEIPSELNESVKSFKEGVKSGFGEFLMFSGSSRGVDTGHEFSFLAFADEKANELLVLSVGEDLCR
ncbi:MAG TPA: hypothetical protein VFV50_00395 [Bdellovibrionales bacterium]|nr:hypothetical protein [Bdellovibrionales bacterium]